MADFTKFNELLRANEYTPIQYFSCNKYCNFVKIIHHSSGNIFFLYLSRSYKMTIPEETLNHYVLTREEVQNKEFESKQLNEYYPLIQLKTSETDVFDNMSDKLKTNYKQAITIHTETAMDHVEQMKRIKYCFKTLEYKCTLQTDQHIIVLTQENTIDVYKIENFPRIPTKTFYINVTLEQMYSKINIIHNLVHQVEQEFYNVLNLNQERHKDFFNIHYIEHFIKNNDQLLNKKRKMQSIRQDIVKVLDDLQIKESNVLKKLDLLYSKPSHNIFQDASNSKQKETLETSLEKIKHTKLQVLDRVIQLDSKIKNMYLIIDQLGFNLSLSLNELRNELEMMLK